MFAPLHIISGYSFLKSGLTIENIQKSIKENNYFGAGLCDLNVLHGVPDFVNAMQAIKKPSLIGIKLLIGSFYLCIYALDEDGYRHLCYLSSIIDDQDKVQEYLKLKHNGLLGILSTSEKNTKAKFKNIEDASIRKIKDISNLVQIFYIGIDFESDDDETINDKIRQFAFSHTYFTIAFPLILYAKKQDAIVLEIVSAIDQDVKINQKEKEGERYFKTEQEYQKTFLKQEIDLTYQIFDLVHFNFLEKRGDMLSYPCANSFDELKRQCFEKLHFLNLESSQYQQRLNYELNIIQDMGYSDYFLIVADYVRYANSVGILTGPGRGSAAGSLVSFLTGITKIDPLKYGLLFERFLNPSRRKMPDIDIDFMDTRRDEVVAYLKNKYGNNKVANIITFSTILAKQSLRDIGRIYNYNNRDIDLLSSRLLNHNFNLRQSYKKINAFKQLVDSDQYYLNIVSLASKIENLPRQSGLHAAGIVLNNTPIEYSLPILHDFQNNYITQYEMNHLEKQGFLKMDLLGLRNLTVISECVDLINATYPNANIDKFNVPFDEKEAYELISSNMTMGVFQLESSGMKNAISLLKPNCFDDIVALLALFRPGPMDSIPIYARRKQGLEKPTYISDDLKDILSPTYGIIVYQEQIIQIAQKMAGFDLAKADTFRQAISKKNKEEIQKVEKDFIDGSIKNGYSLKTANDVYQHILKFANYGFNKSHSVGYAIIACQMAYLKAHYPLQFYATILTSSGAINDTKFLDYVYEMKIRGIQLLLPNINESEDVFIIKNNSLLLPLTTIKGVPISAINSILKERHKNGAYKTFVDFVCRIHPYKISENQINKIINSGAFDCLNTSRASLKASLISIMQYAEVVFDNDGQLSLNIELTPPPKMAKINDDPIENLQNEYDSIGIMLSNNPLTFKKDLLAKHHVIPINIALTMQSAIVAGIIKSIKVIQTKKQEPMAFIKIFDEYQEMELTIFSDLYQQNISLISKNNTIVCKVRKNVHQNNISFIVEQIKPLEE